MKIARYNLSVDVVPVDFFADPDGSWEFDDLVEASGFDPDRPGICVGALTEAFLGHPEGSAVVTEMGRTRAYVAVVECGSGSPGDRAAARAERAAARARAEDRIGGASQERAGAGRAVPGRAVPGRAA